MTSSLLPLLATSDGLGEDEHASDRSIAPGATSLKGILQATSSLLPPLATSDGLGEHEHVSDRSISRGALNGILQAVSHSEIANRLRVI